MFWRAKNIIKSWILLGFLLFLLIWLGYYLASIFNNYLFLLSAVVISLLINFFTYFYSDKFIILTVGARPVERSEFPELFQLVEELSQKAGFREPPKIYLIETDQPNALATGRNPKHSAVIVTRGLLKILSRSQLKAVLAHEISHIKNYDILISTIAVIIATVITHLAYFLRWGIFFSDEEDRGGSVLSIFLLSIVLPISAVLIHLAISRKREFLADADGAKLAGEKQSLIEALEKIHKASFEFKVQPTVHSLFFDNPDKSEERAPWFLKLFMTHPPIEERIRALEQLEF